MRANARANGGRLYVQVVDAISFYRCIEDDAEEDDAADDVDAERVGGAADGRSCPDVVDADAESRFVLLLVRMMPTERAA